MKKGILAILCLITILGLFIPGCSDSYDINELYEVDYNGDFTYEYVIKDKNNNILLSDKCSSREPKVNVINQNLLSVSIQAGTGLSTRWTIYCDVNSGKVSDTYYSVLGEYDDNVVFVDFDNGEYSIVIQDIFDKEQYFKKVRLDDVARVTEPVTDFEKLDDSIKIVYLKDDNYSEAELIIEI